MRRTVAALLVIFLCAGCAVNRSIYIPYDSKIFPPKAPLDSVFIGDEPSRPYEEMGTLIAYGQSFEGYDRVNEILKQGAREIGADAVIKVRYHQESIFRIGFILTLGYTVAAGQGVAPVQGSGFSASGKAQKLASVSSVS